MYPDTGYNLILVARAGGYDTAPITVKRQKTSLDYILMKNNIIYIFLSVLMLFRSVNSISLATLVATSRRGVPPKLAMKILPNLKVTRLVTFGT